MIYNYIQAIQNIEQNYTDSSGLIVQKNKDGGDSTSRIGIYYYLRSLNEGHSEELSMKFNKALSQIEIEPGIYIRHPFQPEFPLETYTNDPKEFSRDQTIPLVIALGNYPEQEFRLKSLEIQQHSRPFFKFQNGDLFGPLEASVYLRANNNPWFYPWLLVSDLGLLFNASIRCFKRLFWPSDTSDDVVLSLAFIQAYNRQSTPISWFSRQIYKLSKPQNALDSYFNEESGAPPLNQIYQPQMLLLGFK